MGYSTLATFPAFAGLSLPILRKPIWRTIVEESVAGVETPLQLWTFPRYEYELPFSFLRQASTYAEIQSLISFYHTLGARGTAFQYQDPNDNVAVQGSTALQTIAIANGVSTSFQIVRNYGGFIEPVYAVSTISAVFENGSSVSSTKWTISNAGILSFSTYTAAAGSSVQWSGTLNWICRFVDDTFDLSQITVSSDRQGPIWELKKLTFRTVKLGA
jgi:uncharacterized protein (TIGR02217 family)